MIKPWKVKCRNNYDLGLIKADNGFKIHIFNIIDVKDIKYERQKYKLGKWMCLWISSFKEYIIFLFP